MPIDICRHRRVIINVNRNEFAASSAMIACAHLSRVNVWVETSGGTQQQTGRNTLPQSARKQSQPHRCVLIYSNMFSNVEESCAMMPSAFVSRVLHHAQTMPQMRARAHTQQTIQQ